MPTPHISAKENDFAKTVLMPGDPLRAKYIADNFLEGVKCVTQVRNMLGFTGTYKGKEVSTMGSGMGMPSISIYAKELFDNYGVENIIRIGTAGGFIGANLKDIILITGASSDSNINKIRFPNLNYSAVPDFDLLIKTYNTAKKEGIEVKTGSCFSSDLFYNPLGLAICEEAEKAGSLCVEMEAAALFGVATECKKKALAICTVSDLVFDNTRQLTAKERETSLNTMITLALKSLL